VNPPTSGSLMEEQLRRMLARTPRVAARPDLVVDLIRPVDARRPPARRERPGPRLTADAPVAGGLPEPG